MPRPLIALLLLTFSVAGAVAHTQDSNKPRPHEQVVFSSEDYSVEHPVDVPQAVLEILRKDSNASADELQETWLLASEIHLNGRNEVDLIVIGVGGLRGPHVVPFWIFRKTLNEFRLVLKTGGDQLSVLNTRGNGYRDVEVSVFSVSTVSTTVYRFNGRKYVMRKRKN